jgi:GNAT superfamily N-acetyltransferase
MRKEAGSFVFSPAFSLPFLTLLGSISVYEVLWDRGMKNLRVSIEPHADEKLKQFIRESLGAYNLAVTGQEEYYPVAIFLRHDNDEVLGGVLGHIWGHWLYVSDLWLAAPLRRSGYGQQLLSAAERYAREKGCGNAWLTTHSFQARPFYEKFGYELFATLDEFPPGHKLYFLKKQLTEQTKISPRRLRSKKPVSKGEHS